jgi:hypothetical protein
MGCPSLIVLANNLTFSVTTHDPATAALTDAVADPSYRVFEDLTAVPILTGTMPKLDDVNTTGFYAAQLACTVANGFEVGKTYTIYIEATVNGVTGGISYAFTIDSCSNFPAGSVEFTYTVVSSVTGLPLSGVSVWISTDIAGTNVVWSGTTDLFGIARDVLLAKPFLDPGPFYFWRSLSGYGFQNPDLEVVI